MISIKERKIHLLVYSHLKSLRKTSKLTNVSKSSLSRWNKKDILIPKYKNNKNKHIQIISNIAKLILEINPFFTINEILKIITETHNIECSYSLLRCILIKELKFSYKKIKYAHYTNEKVLKEKQNKFCYDFKKIYKPDSLVAFVDDVGFNHRINPLYAWSAKGKETRIKIKIGTAKQNKNKSVCCCITSKGDITYIPKTTPYNNISFLKFLKRLKLPRNTIFVLDNVRFHHSLNVKNYMENMGWNVLYTPPYSPWFNPIENIFGIIKSYFRKNKSISSSFNLIKSNIIIDTIHSHINKIYI